MAPVTVSMALAGAACVGGGGALGLHSVNSVRCGGLMAWQYLWRSGAEQADIVKGGLKKSFISIYLKPLLEGGYPQSTRLHGGASTARPQER